MERAGYKQFLPFFAASALSFSIAGVAGADIVINEVFYDPDGPDTGREWIELYSRTSRSLRGVTLEFGNGSRADQWSLVWSGAAEDWIEGGSTFLVGRRDQGPVDAGVDLALQNGPDGLRLRSDGVEVDRVGWGDLEFPEYFEEQPASRSGSGKSLARVGDGVDSNNNARDFVGALPTPGRSNAPDIDLGISLYVPGRSLPLPALAVSQGAVLELRNLGQRSVPRSAIRLWVAGRELDFPLPDLEAGAAWSLVVEIPVPSSPIVRSVAVVRCQGDQVSSNDRAEIVFARLPGPLQFRRIHPRPESGHPEWIELEALGPVTGLGGWRVEDAGGGTFEFDALSPAWSPGDLRRLRSGTEESTDGSRDWLSGRGWPSLNDVEKADGSADTLFLIDREGRVRDWAAFGSLERGQTWIRVGGSPAPAGVGEWVLESTEGQGPDDQSALPSARPWSADRPYVSLTKDAAGIWFEVPSPGSFSLEIFDLLGRSVWRTSGETVPGRPQASRWDGRDRNGQVCAEGVYVLQARTRRDLGQIYREEQTVVLGR